MHSHTRLLLSLLAACGSTTTSLEPPLSPVTLTRPADAGAAIDAGATTDGGTDGGTDGAVDGGTDAGCTLRGQECGSGFVCLHSSPATPPPTACFPGCDVVRQDCGGGLRCEYAENSDGGAPVRACISSTGSKPKGAACQAAGECGVGLVCLASGTGGVCEQYCHTVADCPQGDLCLERVDFEGEYPLICSPAMACDPFQPNCARGEGGYLTVSGSACKPAACRRPWRDLHHHR